LANFDQVGYVAPIHTDKVDRAVDRYSIAVCEGFREKLPILLPRHFSRGERKIWMLDAATPADCSAG
jgi:hypothetical protein